MALVHVTCHSCKKVHAFDGMVPFRAECDACSADLHVCITCRFYDRFVENECREPQAEPVAVKDRRNLCEYWRAKEDAGADDDTARAKAKLNALFGGAAPAKTPDSPSSSSSSSTSAADEAKRKLEALFKKKGDQ